MTDGQRTNGRTEKPKAIHVCLTNLFEVGGIIITKKHVVGAAQNVRVLAGYMLIRALSGHLGNRRSTLIISLGREGLDQAAPL